MAETFNKIKLKKLYENDHFKEIFILSGFKITFDRCGNKASLIKIFNNKSVSIYIKAIIWNINNPLKYETVTSKLTLSSKEIETISPIKIRKELVNNIYKQVIKNKIMMI